VGGADDVMKDIASGRLAAAVAEAKRASDPRRMRAVLTPALAAAAGAGAGAEGEDAAAKAAARAAYRAQLLDTIKAEAGAGPGAVPAGIAEAVEAAGLRFEAGRWHKKKAPPPEEEEELPEKGKAADTSPPNTVNDAPRDKKELEAETEWALLDALAERMAGAPVQATDSP
jgi:hypothetical protein